MSDFQKNVAMRIETILHTVLKSIAMVFMEESRYEFRRECGI